MGAVRSRFHHIPHSVPAQRRPPSACVHECSWGSAANGRLGTGQLEESPHPEMIPDLEEQVAGLACGLDHTLLLAVRAQQ